MAADQTPAALVKLLCHQQQQCWQKGERPRAESYLEQYPTLAADPTCAVELIFQEFLLREQLGEAPQPEEFVQRFPQFAHQLRLLFQVDRQIGEEWPQDDAVADASTNDRPPSPNYEILGELGRGGMSIVYRARQRGLNRLVALKRIREGALAGAEHRRRFRTEAEAIARLHHPNIVQIFHVGEEDGSPFFSLELMDGGNLAAKLGGVPLPARAAAELVATLARAMQAAHAQGIIHRDLKPANVLLARSDSRAGIRLRSPDDSGPGDYYQPKISDFGLAKLLTGVHGVETQSGAVLGTPSYMAPEQAQGKTKTIGPATDIYALGAILYELLTGRPPFRAETALETLHQVQTVEPVPPSRLQPQLARDLETMTLKCLAKEPARRYPTAGALADDLQRWLEGRPIQARPAGVVERGWRWCRRNPGLAGALGAATFFLVLGTLISSLLAVWALGEARRADQEAARERARHYASEMKLASLDWEAGRPDLVQQRLREQEPHRAGEQDLRSFEWYYLQRLCQLELRTLQGHTGPVTGVAFSPDGRWLASASEDGSVRLWDTATRRETFTLTGHAGPVWGVAFSPGGRLAAANEDGTVRLWDAASGEAVLTLQGHTSAIYGVAFSPDAKHLASAGRDQTVKVWDLATGQESFRLTGHTGPVRSVVFSPDGKRLATAGEDRNVQVWDAATGQKFRTLEGHTGAVYGVAFSPSGNQLASASWDQTVIVWDAATGHKLRTIEGYMAKVFGVAFSPDGNKLASASQTGKVQVWDAATGQQMPPLITYGGRFSCVAFSPDGRRLVGAGLDGTVRLWDAALRQQTLIFKEYRKEFFDVVFSPDGRRLASAGDNPTVRLWDAATGEEIHALQGHTGPVTGVAFSPDGKHLASASWDGTARLWDAVTGQEILTFRGHTDGLLGVAFSPDGRRLASIGHDGTVRVWDAATGQQTLTPLPGPPPQPLIPYSLVGFRPAFSPDGKRLASASRDNCVRVWDVSTGRELLTCQGHTDRVFGVAFSPDGKRLASAGSDRTVRLWDAATGQETLCLRGDFAWPSGVAFSPDGRRLAFDGENGTVQVWDATTGQEILVLKHTGIVMRVAVSPDGRRLVSGSLDGTVKVWDATELTPARRIECEARGLARWLFEESPLPALPAVSAGTVALLASPQGPLLAASALLPRRRPLPEEVTAAIRRDPTITEAVRQQALAWVGPYSRIQLRQAAQRCPALGSR